MAEREEVATARQLWRLNLEGRLQIAQSQAAPLSSGIANEELAALLRERYPGCKQFPRRGAHAELELAAAD